MKKTVLLGLGVLMCLVGCTRIETGEVGLRVNASKQVESNELTEGTWNQTIIGDVKTFPIKDIAINVDDAKPLTADNSQLADFDVSVVYAINPTSVSELYTKKSKSFHLIKDGDVFLMYNRMQTLASNAAFKSVRNYKSLEVADNRTQIEAEIKQYLNESLKAEGLETAITIVAAQVRSVQPNEAILAAATKYVTSQNELKIKENEVKLAALEAERMKALSNNSAASIQFMQAQAMLNISEGVKSGKVQTIIVPSNMTSLMVSK